nr:coatomer subunit beta'-3-like [Tanacetum cinerariifolium]
MLLRNLESTWRGAAAFLHEPMTECGQRVALNLAERILYFNVKCNTVTKPLAGITFRDSVGDMDMHTRVYRWDRDHLELVFKRGFEARCQANTPIETYYNLESFVHGVVELIYRYDIYAPGGILVPKTLGEHYLYPGQAKVTFPSGIAPRYIRSAQPFFLSRDGSVHPSFLSLVLHTFDCVVWVKISLEALTYSCVEWGFGRRGGFLGRRRMKMIRDPCVAHGLYLNVDCVRFLVTDMESIVGEVVFEGAVVKVEVAPLDDTRDEEVELNPKESKNEPETKITMQYYEDMENVFSTPDAIVKGKLWRLCDAHGKPPGVIGWWPSRSVTFLDNQWVVAGADDMHIRLYNYNTMDKVKTLEAHTHNVSAVCFHPELPIILTGSEDGTLRIWHATTYRGVEADFVCYDQERNINLLDDMLQGLAGSSKKLQPTLSSHFDQCNDMSHNKRFKITYIITGKGHYGDGDDDEEEETVLSFEHVEIHLSFLYKIANEGGLYLPYGCSTDLLTAENINLLDDVLQGLAGSSKKLQPMHQCLCSPTKTRQSFNYLANGNDMSHNKRFKITYIVTGKGHYGDDDEEETVELRACRLLVRFVLFLALDRLVIDIKKQGYVPYIDFVLHELDEKEKRTYRVLHHFHRPGPMLHDTGFLILTDEGEYPVIEPLPLYGHGRDGPERQPSVLIGETDLMDVDITEGIEVENIVEQFSLNPSYNPLMYIISAHDEMQSVSGASVDGSRKIDFKEPSEYFDQGFEGLRLSSFARVLEIIKGAQGDHEAEVFQVSNDGAAVAQRRLKDKQLKEKTNTDCLVKEQEKKHLGIKVGTNIAVIGVPRQEGADGNVAEKKKVKESMEANLGKLLKYNAWSTRWSPVRGFNIG